jgi:putative membrane protein
MNLKPVRIILLSAATMLFPVALLAQVEPGTMPEATAPNDQAPSNRPQLPRTQQRNARPSMQDSVGSSGQTAQMTKDQMFVRKVVEGGLAQIQFGELAAEKGGDDVKALGQKMVEDHGKLNKDLEDVADSMGVMLPKRINKMDEAELGKLKALSGDAFDKEYLTMMVKDHHHDLREFRVEAEGTQDAALRDAVVKGAQTIHEHLVAVDRLAKSKGVELPHHGHGTAPALPPPPPPTE